MKKLTKIRLINWHYFANETIHVKNHTLITGQNATGKSTIVDAIAFVLTAGDQIFNIAANEKSKRDLRSYVKCKLGTDNQEYLRDQDTTGHIALEFFDEKKEKYFTINRARQYGKTTTLFQLKNLLKDKYRVRVANSGKKALNYLEISEVPDLILLDIMMPELSGYDVIKLLKQNKKTKDIPVIFLTAMRDMQDEQKNLSTHTVI